MSSWLTYDAVIEILNERGVYHDGCDIYIDYNSVDVTYDYSITNYTHIYITFIGLIPIVSVIFIQGEMPLQTFDTWNDFHTKRLLINKINECL